MDKIGEKVQPDAIGGDFIEEEKILLIDLALLQNKWLMGKQYLKENQSEEIVQSKKRVNLEINT